MSAARQAAELDQVDVYRDLVAAVETAVAELGTGEIGSAAWTALERAVGPGPLAALVADIRSSSS